MHSYRNILRPFRSSEYMDYQEQTIRLFSRALLHSVSVLNDVSDTYLYRSLQDAIEQCVRVGVQSGGQGQMLADAIGELHRCLQDVGSTGTTSLRPLLLAERHLLLLLLHVRSTPPAQNPKNTGTSTSPETRSAQGNGAPVETHEGAMNGRLSASAHQIFQGVQETGPVRAKDIIEHCSPMSERTVRRGLRELVSLGLVVKNARNGAVLYQVAQE